MENSPQQIPRAPFPRGKRFNHSNAQRGSRGGTYHAKRDSKPRNTTPRTSMALNCIVDESALLAGLNASDGLKKWVREGSINVYVPLYTLEKLNTLRSSPPPLNLNARKTLEWLDHITSITENKTAGHVELQGPDDQYRTWQEVEKYLLPETPLSSNAGPINLDGITDALDGSLHISDRSRLDVSAVENGQGDSTKVRSVASSSANEGQPTAPRETKHGRHASYSSTVSSYSVDDDSGGDCTQYPVPSTAGIPAPVRPLLNYVVWRTYNEDAAIAGSGKYVLLTDDPATRKQASQFGVRAKLLSQVRSIVSRAENKRSTQAQASEDVKTPGSDPERNVSGAEDDNEDGVDEVVFDPALRPGSSRIAQPASNVWDPDHFGRTPGQPAGIDLAGVAANGTAASGSKPASRGNAGHVPTGPASGRGQPRGARGQRAASSRGQPGATRGTSRHKLEKPIDPDSYARPQPSVKRGRGGIGRLWDPNT